MFNNLLIKAERHHYDRLFSDHKNNSAKLWTHVKEIINKNKSNNNKTNNKFLFGFQPNYSTSYAMITLIE